jgi:hypothetical protein
MCSIAIHTGYEELVPEVIKLESNLKLLYVINISLARIGRLESVSSLEIVIPLPLLLIFLHPSWISVLFTPITPISTMKTSKRIFLNYFKDIFVEEKYSLNLICYLLRQWMSPTPTEGCKVHLFLILDVDAFVILAYYFHSEMWERCPFSKDLLDILMSCFWSTFWSREIYLTFSAFISRSTFSLASSRMLLFFFLLSYFRPSLTRIRS